MFDLRETICHDKNNCWLHVSFIYSRYKLTMMRRGSILIIKEITSQNTVIMFQCPYIFVQQITKQTQFQLFSKIKLSEIKC